MTMFPSGGLVTGFRPPSISITKDTEPETIQPGQVESSALASNKNIIDILRERAEGGDASSMDYLISYLLSEQSAQTAREWTAKREDTQYQRFVQDATKAGINPYFALTGGSPVSSSTQGVNYQGSTYTSASNNQRTTRTSRENNWTSNWFNLVGDIFSLIGNVINSAGKVAAAGVMAA